jgi:hypothetical protein
VPCDCEKSVHRARSLGIVSFEVGNFEWPGAGVASMVLALVDNGSMVQ